MDNYERRRKTQKMNELAYKLLNKVVKPKGNKIQYREIFL